jgi:hypothetical protein
MIKSTARDKSSLKKRVDRFFYTPLKFRGEVSSVIMSLTKETEQNIYAFGGLVRDISLFGLKDFSSDVDLVFDGSKAELEKALSSIKSAPMTENKFGGFRLHMTSWDIDIWSAEDTWAFREGLVEFSGIESLLETTLMSWDSALYDVNHKKLSYREHYLEDILKGRLDIVLANTPNEIGAMVRLGRTIQAKNAKSLSPKAAGLIRYYLDKYSFNELVEYEKQSYHDQFITLTSLDSLSRTLDSDSQNEDVTLDLKQLKLNL